MVNGDSHAPVGKWDAIATCYFIDTAHNILQYIEVIANLLKDGGIWINLGPLLYHFEGMQTEPSIELTLDEVQAAARSYGFVFEKEDWKESSYASCPEAMLQYEYHNAFWVARKMESARSVDLSPAGSS